jgi:hypothetical protein
MPKACDGGNIVQTVVVRVNLRRGGPLRTDHPIGETKMRTLALVTAFMLALAAPARAEVDWEQVGQVFGREIAEQPGGVRKLSLPRSDLEVTVDGVAIKPALALGSWLAFHPMDGDETVAMGDLVLTEDELNPVMRILAEHGIDVTGIHNHLLRAKPAVVYLHVAGHGDPVELAEAFRLALEQSKTPVAFTPSPTGAEEQGPKLDAAALDRVLGHEGKAASGGVHQFSIPRAEPVTDGGMQVPPSMGTAIAINFQPLDGGKAAATGDFVLTAAEVNPVLRTLRGHGIEATALHNHMLHEEPRLFFIHFWGVDEAGKLAEGLRAALGKVNVAKS